MNSPRMLTPLSGWTLAIVLLASPLSSAQTEPDEFLDQESGDAGGAVWLEEGQPVAQDEGGVGYEGEMPQEYPPVEGEVDPAFFFEYLAPYGDWMWTPEHGWVWHPTGLEPDWRPYSNGRWVYTTYGWTWVAYEPWGWAPFHYGRWSWMNQVGWIWVPGTTWGPGWVMWRYSDTTIGWAPLLAGYDWWFGWAYYPVFYDHWVFSDWIYFHHRHAHRHYHHRNRARDHFRHTYFPRGCRDGSSPTCQRGPSSRLVERITRLPVERVAIRDLAREPRKMSTRDLGQIGLKGNELTIYRPKATRAPGPGLSAGSGARPGLSRPRVLDFGTSPDRRVERRPTPGADIEPARPAKVRPDRPAGNRMPGPIVSGPDGVRTAPGASRKPGFAPSHSKPGFAPSHSRPGFAPSHSKPGFAPSHSKPGFAPSHSKPGFAPGHSKPGFAPGHSKPGFAPSHSKPGASRGGSPAVRPSSSGGGSKGSSGGSRGSSGGGGSKGSSGGGGGSKGSSGGGKRK